MDAYVGPEVVNIPNAIAQSLLAARSDAIIAVDRDGIICFWNPGAQRIFDHHRDDAVGRSLDLIIPERLRQRHWDGVEPESRLGEAVTATATSVRFLPFTEAARRSRSSLPLCPRQISQAP